MFITIFLTIFVLALFGLLCLKFVWKSRYQTWEDWILGRFQCPKCREYNYSFIMFTDVSCVAIANRKVSERFLQCVKCSFRETIFRDETN